MTRKINMTVEGIVMVPVKVTLDVLVRADDDATVKSMLTALGRGDHGAKKFDIEEVSVDAAEFHQLLDAEESLESQVGEYLEGGRPIKVLSHEVYDSR
jgi:hypothetical protein